MIPTVTSLNRENIFSTSRAKLKALSCRTHNYFLIVWFVVCLLHASPLHAQKPSTYIYDDSGRLTAAIDTVGNQITYTYDAVSNIVSVTRGSSPGASQLAILNFTPQSGSPGATVTIIGQNFSSTAANNAVTFNGIAATVLSATSTTLTVTVPPTATTGPVAITVNGATATATSPFTVVASPAVLSVSPQFAVSNAAATTLTAFTVAGANLTGATFSFSPAFSPASIAINSTIVNAGGTSATLSLTVAPGVKGSFTLLATNAAGSSSPVATSSDTLQIISPDDDADGDGITNAVEIALGSNPLNAQTSGQGIADGWQVFYGLNPLSASSAGPDPGKSGQTALYDFQNGLSPVNPNRVPPAVTQIAPANGATGVYINSVVVVRFGEPLRTGTSLAAAQSAIAAALGTNSSVSASSQATAAVTLQGYMNRTCCGNSVIPGTVVVSGPYGAITGGVTASSDGLSVTFSPSVPLTSNTTYTVQVNGVRDVAGNLMTTPFTSTFTTSAAVDNTPPTITLVDPENQSTGVPTNAHYTVQFSKAIDPGTLSSSTFTIFDQTTQANISGTIQIDASLMTASFIPDQPLPVGRSFTVNFTTGIKDTAGNALAASSTDYFSTGYNPETAAPHFVASSPVSGATGIPVNAIVDLQFSQPLNITTVVPNIQVSTGGQAIPVQMALSSGDERVTITPVSGLQANAHYTVTIGAGITNIAGISLDNAGSFSFQTAASVDKNTLTVTSWSPASGTTSVPLNVQPRVSFSKAVDVVSLSSGNLVLYPYSLGSSSPLAGTVSPSSDQMSVTFSPTVPLQAETQYCLSLLSVVDLEGNALSGSATNCFTTGGSSQSSGPVVVGVSPGNNSTGVAVNSVVEVGLNEAVSAVSVGQGAITVSAGGQAVAGTVTMPSATTLLFTPSSPLALSTAYTVTVGGFTDVAGNAATSFTSGFTTSSSPIPVKTGPTVMSVSPGSGVTGIAVTTPIVMTFSAAVNPLTVTSSTFQVSSTSNYDTVAGTYAVNGAVVTFTPLTALPGSSTIRIYESGVQDLAGNNASGSNTTFTTAATLDTTAPTVVMVTPSNGQTGVGLNGQVVVVFSKSMNPSTLTTSTIALLAGDVKQSFSPSVSSDNRTLTLSNLNLPGSTVVTLVISSGAADLSGNALANYTSQFTTAAAFDTTHATVVSQRPATGATNVLTTASPVVLFLNKPLNGSTISGNTVQVTQNGQLVSGTLAVVGNGQTIEFTPSSAWTYGALVQVFLDATALDTSGNAVNAYKGSFTVVGDPTATAPALVNVSPMSGATAVPLNVVLDAQFSGALDPTTVIAANVYLYSYVTSKAIASTLTLDSTGTIVHLTPSSALAANAQYYFYLSNLKGVNGLAVSNAGEYFTTGTSTQTTAPTVVTVSPANNLGNVPVNANIGVTFSGPIDPVTVTGATISVSGGGMTSVPASISFSNSNQTVKITPEAPLPASTTMTLTISGVTDVARNAVTAQTTHFTTGTAAATSAFGVVVENPAASATGVPVNAAISLQANAEIDGTTVTTSTFQVYDQTLNTYMSGTYSLSADGMTVYFVPATQLATGRTYSVNFYYGGMTDLAGNPLTNGCTGCLYNYTFTTGFATSTAAPQVTGVSPSNGLTKVPINAQIVVSFSEPVNGESLAGVTLSANGSTVGLSDVLSAGSQLLTITPAAGLLPNTTYTLTVNGVADQSGNAMTTPVTSTFTTSGTADLTPLTITTVAPASGATGVPVNTQIRVAFSKGVDVVSLAGGNLVLYPNSIGSSYPVPGTLSVSSDGTNVTFKPTANLLAETVYCTYVNGVVDLEGQSLSSSTYQGCFTTGGSSQSSGPSVVLVSPGNSATGVAVNSVVEVGLNEAVSSVSVGQGAITLTAGGQAVAGTVTMPTATTLLFTPASSLAVSTAYTVTVGGFTDLAGSAATGFTSGFTTGSSPTPVKTGPTVIVTPASNATNIAVTTTVVATFSAAVNPLTVTSSTFQVSSTSNYDTVAGTYSVSGAVATFTPLSPLPGSSTIRVYESGVQDLAGNTASSSNTTFTTAATADTTVPTVVMVTPSNGQTGVGLNGQVVVAFSKSMNPSTLTTSTIALLAGDVKQNFSPSLSADNRTLTLTGLSLPGSTVVTLAISSGATDLSGNALANYTSQFTTAAAFDTTHATVVSQRPGTGATNVLTTASPVVLFLNKPLNVSTISGNTVQVTQNGQLVSGTLAVVGNGQTIEFTPSSAWTYGALVQVFLEATALDTSGNTVNAYKGMFTVVGSPTTTAPALVNASPMNGATAVPLNVVPDAQFSGALDPTTVIAANVYLYSYATGKAIPSTSTLDSTGTIIHLAPSTSLTANTQYYFYLYNLKGMNGLAVSNAGEYFTAGTSTQTAAPTVLTVSPANNLSNVPVNANVAVVFSGPIDPITVTGATIAVSGGGMTSVPASISFSNSNQKVLITPEAPLPASTVMTLTISGVKDVAGNTVTAQTTHFTTGTAAATSAFGVVVENPAASAMGVPVNAAISLQANAEIDGTTVTTSSFQVYDTTLNQTVAGSYSLSVDGMTVYFVPAAQLATGRTYQVNFYYGGMTDLAGNALTNSCTGCLYNYTFTTGFTASVAAPQVTGVSPSSGLTKVPINAQIVVAFNEPVNGESLAGVTLSANGSTVGLSDVLSAGNQLLTITPVAGLLPNTTYTLTVNGVADLSGNAMTTANTSTFTTSGGPDLTQATVTSITPINTATGVPTTTNVQIQFSKLMNVLSLTSQTVKLSTNGTTVIPAILTFNQNGTSMTIAPSSALSPSTTYSVQLTTSILDLEGGALTSFQASFTTGTQ